jgi:HlyD family secretion protein
MKTPMGSKKYLGAAAVIGTFVFVYRFLSSPDPIKTELITVRLGDLVVEISDTGQTRFRNVNTVLSPQAGWLSKIHVHTGELITQNKSPLATLSAGQAPLIDSRTRATLKAQAEAAQAQELQASAQLNRVRGTLQATLKDLQRAESVLAGGGVSVQEVESLRARATELKAEVKSAEAMLHAFKHTAEAVKWSFQSNVANTKPESLLLRAPLSGVVSWVYNEKARFVSLAEPLFDIAQPRDLYFEIEILARDSLAIRPGQNVRFTETSLAGEVRSISPTAQPKVSPLGISEQRIRVQIDFKADVPSEWPAGLELEAHIETQRASRTMSLPLSAVWKENEKSYVFAVQDNKLIRKEVRTGISSNQEIEILSGLSGEEKIVFFPSTSMQPGQRVSAGI